MTGCGGLAAPIVKNFMKVALANDFAGRLDRGCASYMYHKGEALLLGGLPIFKLDGLK